MSWSIEFKPIGLPVGCFIRGPCCLGGWFSWCSSWILECRSVYENSNCCPSYAETTVVYSLCLSPLASYGSLLTFRFLWTIFTTVGQKKIVEWDQLLKLLMFVCLYKLVPSFWLENNEVTMFTDTKLSDACIYGTIFQFWLPEIASSDWCLHSQSMVELSTYVRPVTYIRGVGSTKYRL